MAKYVSVLTAILLASGCNDARTATPYEPGTATVIGIDQQGAALHAVPEAQPCKGKLCRALDDFCGADAAGDIVVDEDAVEADVLCYEQDVVVQELPIDEQASAEAGNKTVLHLDDVDDGLDITGDVTVNGNNAVIFGHGPGVSGVGGTLRINKNNTTVRGLRIHGDVTVTKNNTKFAYCQIDGDLTITGNNTTLANCTVGGKVTLEGVNTVLVHNGFAQDATLEGRNLLCNGNYQLKEEWMGEQSLPGDAGLSGAEALDCVNSKDSSKSKSKSRKDAGE